MSRFGSTATLYYSPGETLTSGTYLYLTADSMPNYPFETMNDTDRVIHRTKSGRKYAYQNYNLQKYQFNFSNLKESTRGSLKRMYDLSSIFTFNSNAVTWGTFRFAEEGWQDSEIAFELYDVSLLIEELA